MYFKKELACHCQKNPSWTKNVIVGTANKEDGECHLHIKNQKELSDRVNGMDYDSNKSEETF